jgi:hypothetical protein
VLLELSRHPEIEAADWQGRIELHISGKSVKASFHPSSREIAR